MDVYLYIPILYYIKTTVLYTRQPFKLMFYRIRAHDNYGLSMFMATV